MKLPFSDFKFKLATVPLVRRSSHPKKTRKQYAYKHRLYFVLCLLGILTIFSLFAYLTNPFVRFNLVQDPYSTIELVDDQFQLRSGTSVKVRKGAFFDHLVFLKSGWHIVGSKFIVDSKAKPATVDEIIAQIHAIRFDPSRPFLISGDHFSMLYPRSLGVFYHTLLDPRTAIDEQDWKNRQLMYLKTTAYALDAYSQSDTLSTTIVPVSSNSVVLMNIYQPPSDTLYSLLLALVNLQSSEYLLENYPYQPTPSAFTAQLQTGSAGKQLLEKNYDSLLKHYHTFLNTTVDPATGLVKKDILLSGTKDMAKRQSAFYDNVMVWKTKALAQQLGLVETNQAELDGLKQKIIQTYWLENEGYFLEDQSQEGRDEKWYSSDWLIAYQTGLLDPDDPQDRVYLERSIAYIQRNALDQPFGLQYHADPRPQQLYLPVKLFAPSYGSTAIWSNWGMEYTKLLAHLAVLNQNAEYLATAKMQIAAYSYNIKRYLGYPELYDLHGDFYQERSYKSIRQTGWVVTFEQAREMVAYADRAHNQ